MTASINTKHQRLKEIAFPLAAWLIFFIYHYLHIPFFNILVIVALVVTTLQAVHHAEIIALRLGQPFGSIVLALAITAIEAALIISMMLASGPDGKLIARDTVFAAVMIIITGLVGVSIFAGGIRFKEQKFILQGVNAALITLVSIAVLTLILPNYTVSSPGPTYTSQQLLYVSIVSLILYGSFIFVQTVKHKDYFVHESEKNDSLELKKPSAKQSQLSIILLVLCLGAVVMLAEALAPDLDALLNKYQAPHALAGVIIACIVLLPEGLSAYKAAKNNELQTALNLTLGSALASIGLTIPIVSIVAVITGMDITLGIDAVSTILFFLSFLIIMLSLSTGKTTILHGIALMVIFLTYIFTIIFP